LKRRPGGLTEAYGLTEGGGVCFLAAHLHPNKLHIVGKPAAGHDIRLIDENGKKVPRGEIGEVVGHSPVIMGGHYKRPQRTAAAEWFDASGKRFIRTGDIGRFDEDGFLVLMDRKKDMIISGAFNIYPSDLEAVLAELTPLPKRPSWACHRNAGERHPWRLLWSAKDIHLPRTISASGLAAGWVRHSGLRQSKSFPHCHVVPLAKP